MRDRRPKCIESGKFIDNAIQRDVWISRVKQAIRIFNEMESCGELPERFVLQVESMRSEFAHYTGATRRRTHDPVDR